MAKDDRSPINPFTGKEHYDKVNDDEFLEECYSEYYNIINQSQIADNSYEGQLLVRVAINLISAVENYLSSIGRLDYIKDYYDWEFHLLLNDTVNAFCIPGGKIAVFFGIFSVASSEEELAFILGHEMAHALLDHTRTRVSAQNTKNNLTTASLIGSFAFDLLGLGEIGSLTRAAVNTVSVGSQFLLMNPWGRDQELEADFLGMLIIHWAGYSIKPIPDFWKKMSNQNSNNFDFFSTHPADDKRIAVMDSLVLKIDNGMDYSYPVLSNDFKDSQLSLNNTKKCPHCSHMEDISSKFCTNCGYEFSDEIRCSECGSIPNEGDVFCTNCGNKL